jgi:hypothetical protein
LTDAAPDDAYNERVRDRHEMLDNARADIIDVIHGNASGDRAIYKLAEAMDRLAVVLKDVSEDCRGVRAGVALDEGERSG